ncbi:hypothetical protein SLS57_010692, partial [Botryosphaeria dothidea]
FGDLPDHVDLTGNRTPGDNAAVVILVAISSVAMILRLMYVNPDQSEDMQGLNYRYQIFVFATAGLSIAGEFGIHSQENVY